jgi:hypothetical protein
MPRVFLIAKEAESVFKCDDEVVIKSCDMDVANHEDTERFISMIKTAYGLPFTCNHVSVRDVASTSECYKKLVFGLGADTRASLACYCQKYDVWLGGSMMPYGIKVVDERWILNRPNSCVAVVVEMDRDEICKYILPISGTYPKNAWDVDYYHTLLSNCLSTADNPLFNVLGLAMDKTQAPSLKTIAAQAYVHSLAVAVTL